MKKSISKSINIDDAVIIDADFLKRLNDFLKDYSFIISCKVECVNDESIIFSNIEELLFYSNEEYRKIREIKILGNFEKKGYFFCNDFSLEIEEGVSYKTINYEYLFNDVKQGDSFKNNFPQLLKEINPWYSIFYKINISSLLLPSLILFFLILRIISVYNESNNIDLRLAIKQLSIDTNDNLLIIIVFVLILMIIYNLLKTLTNYLFPKVFFKIGAQKNELQRRENIRNWIFNVVIVAIGIGLLINFLSDKMF